MSGHAARPKFGLNDLSGEPSDVFSNVELRAAVCNVTPRGVKLRLSNEDGTPTHIPLWRCYGISSAASWGYEVGAYPRSQLMRFLAPPLPRRQRLRRIFAEWAIKCLRIETPTGVVPQKRERAQGKCRHQKVAPVAPIVYTDLFAKVRFFLGRAPDRLPTASVLLRSENTVY